MYPVTGPARAWLKTGAVKIGCARGLPVPSVNSHPTSPARRLSPAHFLYRNGYASGGVSKKWHIELV